MNYDTAMELLDQGKKVSRTRWDGKNMWLCIGVPGSDILNRIIRYNTFPCICMKLSQYNKLVKWFASQNDMVANDWKVVE